MSILSLRGLRKNFGATEIIRGVDLDIEAGEKHAIIGPNGAGKSTLFHLISGKYSPTSGAMEFKGQPLQNLPPHRINRLGIARSFQVTNIFPRMSVFENIRCALLWPSGFGYSFWRLLEREQGLNEKTEQVLDRIGLAGRAQFPAGEIAYSEQRALELGMAIAGGAELILLDEPVAGMSHSEADNAVQLIRRVTEGKTLVMVEHDMNIVFDLADRISVLVYGELIATGAPAEIRADAQVQEAYLGEVRIDGDAGSDAHPHQIRSADLTPPEGGV